MHLKQVDLNKVLLGRRTKRVKILSRNDLNNPEMAILAFMISSKEVKSLFNSVNLKLWLTHLLAHGINVTDSSLPVINVELDRTHRIFHQVLALSYLVDLAA